MSAERIVKLRRKPKMRHYRNAGLYKIGNRFFLRAYAFDFHGVCPGA